MVTVELGIQVLDNSLGTTRLFSPSPGNQSLAPRHHNWKQKKLKHKNRTFKVALCLCRGKSPLTLK